MSDEAMHVSSAESLSAITRAEVDGQIATAKRYPRSIKNFINGVKELATIDEDTAASCYYHLERKKKDGGKAIIEGPSVRMAEIVASKWGNCRIASRIVGDDGKMVTAQAIAHDLETNVAVSVELSVSVVSGDGRRFSPDMVVMNSNAVASKARRNAIFAIVPLALVNPMLEEAKRVARGSAETMEFRKQKMLDYFAKQGVKDAEILTVLGRPGVPDMTLDDLVVLRGIATAIKDGETTIDETFRPAATAPKRNEKLEAQIAAEKSAKSKATPATNTAQAPVAAPEPSAAPQADAVDPFEAAMAQAKAMTPAQLQGVVVRIKGKKTGYFDNLMQRNFPGDELFSERDPDQQAEIVAHCLMELAKA